jgi:uncharacterized repeat protein (TIGR03803 family)
MNPREAVCFLALLLVASAPLALAQGTYTQIDVPNSHGTAIASRGQTFKTLVSFNVTNGAGPISSLIQSFDGKFYGPTAEGGTGSSCPFGCGTVFKIAPGGALTQLYSFCPLPGCSDGASPEGTLVQAFNGNFYGTTYQGGTNAFGTVFKISPTGAKSTLYNFCSQTNCTDGSLPQAGLVLAADGSFYGTTDQGGSAGFGTVFKITMAGTLTTLYSFCAQGNCADGLRPHAPLIQGTDGSFYGTAGGGGTNNYGTVFTINSDGGLTTLHSFSNATDGAYPNAGLVQATDGNFYGTTTYGGSNACFLGCGTVFKITPGGQLTTLHKFRGPDGYHPEAGLVQGTDGNFYGTSNRGGSHGLGTIFKVTSAGKLSILHNFDTTEGTFPSGGLVQGTDGSFYGTTSAGGTDNAGTIFNLSVGLAPFIKTLPTFGKVGAAVKILGTNLTGATSVTFNGTPATFAVASPTLIKTTVPIGATTGQVQVVTPRGTLTSNSVFRVR